MTTTPAVRVDALVKEFRTGRGTHVRALDGLDLEVAPGEVFGFLGPNGAGKSTTIRVLLDLLRPTSGHVAVLGTDPRAGGARLRARIGYLPGELSLTSRASAQDLLVHQCRLRGGAGTDRIDALAQRFGLDLSRSARTLSKGNKQKLGVIQAFAHRPELLILDEPTSGLDPLLQREFLDLVREARDGGATVLMSSHVLSEVEAVAERVAIIRQGRLVDLDDVATLRRRAGQDVRLRLAGHVPADAFDRIDGLRVTATTDGDTTVVTGVLQGDPQALLERATAHRVVRATLEDRELEDLFLDHYRVPATELADDTVEGHR